MALQKVFERGIFLTHSFIIQVTILFTQHTLFARHVLISVNTKVTKNRVTILMELPVLTTVVA